jgi:diaminopimelate epimerase
MYLRRRGWTDSDTFSIQTAAGEMRPRITGDTTCTMDMGRAKLTSKDFPSGGEEGTGSVESGGRAFEFQHVSIGNPQCSIEIRDGGLGQLDLPAIGPAIEHSDLFPNRTNVSFWTPVAENAIRARIFERGVGETMSSGTGAVGAAVSAVLRGVESPVTVQLDGGELEVEVGEDMHVNLTGWAVPVYEGTLSDEFLEELLEIE